MAMEDFTLLDAFLIDFELDFCDRCRQHIIGYFERTASSSFYQCLFKLMRYIRFGLSMYFQEQHIIGCQSTVASIARNNRQGP